MSDNKLYAGAAKCDISPDEEMLPLPFVESITLDFVKDRIFVRTLYLECNGEELIIMTFDMGEVPYPEETRSYIQEITGLSKKTIFLAGTHTHNTPFMGYHLMPVEKERETQYRRYYEKIKRALKTVITKAKEDKCQAQIGFGKGNSYINVNRDELIGDKAEVGNNYERPSDKTVRLIRVETIEHKLIALLVNYAVHGVFLNGNFVNDKIGISGDIPGQTSQMLEEKLGGVTLWTSGAAGDQNPRVMTNYGYVEESGTMKTKCVGEGAYYILNSLVEEHVRDILKANANIKCKEGTYAIQAFEEEVFVDGVVGDPVPYQLSLLKIDDINILGINAEVVTSIGEAIRDTINKENTILITHAQGSIGYVCDDWQYEYQSFETGMAAAKRGAAEPAFAEAFSEMVK